MRLERITLVFSCYDDFIGLISAFCRIILKQLTTVGELLRLFGLVSGYYLVIVVHFTPRADPAAIETVLWFNFDEALCSLESVTSSSWSRTDAQKR